MATELSAARSTNELLLAATKGEAEAVEALYTHYRQFGIDVAAEHGFDDPEAAFGQVFVEAMANSHDLSQGAPGSFATALENMIRDLAETPAPVEPVEVSPDEPEAKDEPDQHIASDELQDDGASDEPGEHGASSERPGEVEQENEEQDKDEADDGSVEESAWAITATIPVVDLEPAVGEPTFAAPGTGEPATPLGVLPLAATPARPRTPNQLFDRLHPRSLVSLIAAAFLLALIAWVFVESTSSSSDGRTDAPSDPSPGAVTEPSE